MLSMMTLFRSVSVVAIYLESPSLVRSDLISARKAFWTDISFARLVKMVLNTLELTSTLVNRISSRVARNCWGKNSQTPSGFAYRLQKT